MPTDIAIAVVEQAGAFLIGQRPAGAPLAGLWEFPGGKSEPGETPEAAATRECASSARMASWRLTPSSGSEFWSPMIRNARPAVGKGQQYGIALIAGADQQLPARVDCPGQRGIALLA